MSENSLPDSPPYTPATSPAPNEHTRVRTALAELLARPGLPNLFIFLLANLLRQINQLPPQKTPISSLPQSYSQDASTGMEPTRGDSPRSSTRSNESGLPHGRHTRASHRKAVKN